MARFNIILTEICNAYCSHCYMNANSLGMRSTMKNEDIKSIINNMPNNTEKVVLTGGEVFLKEDLLFFALKEIRKRFADTEIEIESNGKSFYENKDKTIKTLKRLMEYKVDSIRFSLDVFHQMGGIDLCKVKSIKDTAKGLDIKIKFLEQDSAVPFGRAKMLEERYHRKSMCMNNVETLKNPYVFVDVKGNCYFCTWKISESFGNLIEENFEKLYEKLTDLQKNILIGNIDKVIKIYSEGNTKKINDLEKIAREKGQCLACELMFKEGKNKNGS